MFPINLDLRRLTVLVVGDDAATARRLGELDQAGAASVKVFSADPCRALRDRAGDRLTRGLPQIVDMNAAAIVFVINIDTAIAADLANTARAVGTLVNVEDVKPFCDFYSPSRIQRGDLLVTVSTNGKSPRLAGRIRRAIESWLVPEWAGRLEELAAQRGIWRTKGASMKKLTELTDKYIDDRKWL